VSRPKGRERKRDERRTDTKLANLDILASGTHTSRRTLLFSLFTNTLDHAAGILVPVTLLAPGSRWYPFSDKRPEFGYQRCRRYPHVTQQETPDAYVLSRVVQSQHDIQFSARSRTLTNERLEKDDGPLQHARCSSMQRWYRRLFQYTIRTGFRLGVFSDGGKTEHVANHSVRKTWAHTPQTLPCHQLAPFCWKWYCSPTPINMGIRAPV
jgi:hypothetical protein